MVSSLKVAEANDSSTYSSQNGKGRKKSNRGKKNKLDDIEISGVEPYSSQDEKEELVKKISESIIPETHENKADTVQCYPAEPSQEDCTRMVLVKDCDPDNSEKVQTESEEKEEEKLTVQIATNEKFDSVVPVLETALETPQLMDESIISVPESPPILQCPKDSTFSPVVDTSIHDLRPVITNEPKAFPLRTSTPLAQHVLKFVAGDSSKRQNAQIRSMPKDIIVEKTHAVGSSEQDDNFFAQFKRGNPLDRSILKSSRKRSFSVTEADSFMQKRVMFISPQVMEIGAIDEKMMASFMEEQENSMMKQAAGSSRRKRSLSTGAFRATPAKQNLRVKMPNFSAIHERQFEKMESIGDNYLRRVERAKKLATPVRDTQSKAMKVQADTNILKTKSHASSKIPTKDTRKPLTKVPSIENMLPSTRHAIKRSISTPDVTQKKIAASHLAGPSTSPSKKVAIVNALQRTKSEEVKTTFSGLKSTQRLQSSSQSVAQMNRIKVEERRERNMALHKTNYSQRSTSDFRVKNAQLLKGVRFNRRFELQMQHRRGQGEFKDES